MTERKDDLIIGLLVILIILQVYGLFFGQASTTRTPAAPATTSVQEGLRGGFPPSSTGTPGR